MRTSLAFSFLRSWPPDCYIHFRYRMQLWTRMAQQHQQHQLSAASQHQQPSLPPLSGLAAGLRPHYFSSAQNMRSSTTAPTLSSLLSGKHSHSSIFTSASTSTSSAGASAYPTPPASPKPTSTFSSSAPSPQHAALATMASQTLVQRLGGAFWHAFAGSPSQASSS